eukprot:107799_1
MTTLEKLQLQGVRSYDPLNPCTLKFFKPLTIIVGRNGSGKTTIIEALKFVCTGSNPPCSQGGKTFVHDPKFLGDAIVKAQIRVQFRTSADTPVIVCRSFQLTQRKKSRTYKNIDAVIKILTPEGEERTMSHKCTDMEKLVPELMGVSKAILENVIFCHQEDSCWPLTDPKTLKSKFDDIFASTRYTKALDNIKKFRNEQGKKIREIGSDLQVLAANMEHAHRCEDEYEQLKEQMAKCTNEQGDLKQQIGLLETNLREARERKQTIANVNAEIARLSYRCDEAKKSRKEVHRRMQVEYSESDEDLNKMRANHSGFLNERNTSISSAKHEIEKLNREQNAIKEEFQRAVRLQGKLEAEEARFKRELAEGASLMRALSHAYDLPCRLREGESASVEQLAEFLSKMSQILNKDEQNLIKHKEQSRKIDLQLEEEVRRLREKFVRLKSDFAHKRRQKEQNLDQLHSLEKQLQDLKMKLDGLSDVQAKIADAQRRFEDFTSNSDSAHLCEQIKAKTANLHRNTNKSDMLQAELKTLRAQAQATEALKFKRKNVQAKENEFQSAMESCRQKVSTIASETGVPMPHPREYAQLVDKRLSELTNEKREVSHRLQSLKQDLGTCSGQLQLNKKQMSEIQKEHRAKNERVQSVIGEKNLRQTIAEIEKKKSNAANSDAHLKSAQGFYSNFKTNARNKKECPVCERGMCSSEVESFVELIDSKINVMNKNFSKRKNLQVIQSCESQLRALNALHPVVSDLARLASEIPNRQRVITDLGNRKDQLSRSISDLEAQESDIADNYNAVQNLHSEALKVTRLFSEVESAKSELQREEKRLKVSAGGRRSLEEAQDDYDRIQNENRTLNRELEQSRTRKDELLRQENVLRDRWNSLKEEGQKVIQLNGERSRLNGEYKRITRENQEIQNDLDSASHSLRPIEDKIKMKQAERDQNRREFETTGRKLDERLLQTQKDEHTIRSTVSSVERYLRSAQDRTRIEETIQTCQQRNAEIDNLRKKNDDIISDSMNKLQKAQEVLRDLDLNIEFRQKSIEYKQMGDAVKAKSQELEYIPDYDKIDNIVDEHVDRLSQARSLEAEISGRLKVLTAQALQRKGMLKESTFRDIDKRHRECLIDFETAKMANGDLETYQKALDKALIQFHSQKMKEINQTLKSYWDTVYRGQDIDEIAIVSDQLPGDSSRRNYQYCVVMRQGEVEMEMRGRCSAGQRVLASLLIRLALADTFCVNCGVLCLDEPTTNLDEHNVVAFAESLNELIMRRRDQKKFQLVLITHDEHFVELLGKRDNCDYYYRVFKNQYLHSKIKKTPVGE